MQRGTPIIIIIINHHYYNTKLIIFFKKREEVQYIHLQEWDTERNQRMTWPRK